jgi:hypothetical protein
MAKVHSVVPVNLLIVAAVLLILGLVAGPVIQSLATPQQLGENVLLNAIPFILIFVAILLTFIALIVVVARLLNGRISASIHRPIEMVLIAGIVLGVVALFQPWTYVLYGIGFHVLLVSVLGFTLWSHIVPKREAR